MLGGVVVAIRRRRPRRLFFTLRRRRRRRRRERVAVPSPSKFFLGRRRVKSAILNINFQ